MVRGASRTTFGGWSRRSQRNIAALRDNDSWTIVSSVRRFLAIVLASVIIFQLIPGCGSAGAAEGAQRTCCETKCPAHSSGQPMDCCVRIASPQNNIAKAKTGTPIEPLGGFLVRVIWNVQQPTVPDRVDHRSPTPPPRTSLTLLCSRQI